MWDLKKYKHNMAFEDEFGNKVSYGELLMIQEKIKAVLGRRKLVFILCENKIGSMAGYVSCINEKNVPVLLSNSLDIELLSNLLSIYCPQYIWLSEEKYCELKKIGSLMDNTEIVYMAYGYYMLKTAYEKEYVLNDELALLLTTSGSTGSPKFVRQSYLNISDNAKSIAEYLELNENERPITTLPMNYTYGLSIINSHLVIGATVLVTDKSLGKREFWEFFDRAKATSFGGVPYTYEMLERMRFMRRELPTLKTMTQAGGKLTPELHEKFAGYAAETGKKFIVMYGQCEATARMGYLPAEKAVEKRGSMGIAIPGGVFRLLDTDAKEITVPYVTGELLYEGKNVTLGYAECGEDLQKGDERQGVLLTGDMAQFDEEGYFYIVGRKKRFLKIYGNRVNLDEIDRLIKGKFEIDVASAGMDDHMYIFITDDRYKEEVKAFTVQKTKIHPSAFTVLSIDEIPKNDSGKVLYKELLKYYER